jgi:hypothetical protein
MSADQRYGYRAVLGDRDNWGLLPLGGQQWCHGSDQDAAGAQADDWPSLLEEPRDVWRRTIVAFVPIAPESARSVQPRTRERRSQLPAESGTAFTDRNNRNAMG